MKRICYLLTFFLTGFSIATNEHAVRNTFLLADSEEVSELELDFEVECKELFNAENEPGIIRNSFGQTSLFICSIKK